MPQGNKNYYVFIEIVKIEFNILHFSQPKASCKCKTSLTDIFFVIMELFY
jgi:hypothetical protein